MLSIARLELTLAMCGIMTAYIGLALIVHALVTKHRQHRWVAINLLLFSFLCLLVRSAFYF